MRILLTLICLITVFVVHAQSTTKKLQGLWNSSWVEYIPLPAAADAAFDNHYHNTDLYFEGDSLWEFDLPCERISVNTYSPESFQFVNDSTFDYYNERYSRQPVDSGLIATLKKHQLNPECYAGEWSLIRSESDDDGTGVVFIFPYDFPCKLILSDHALDGNLLKVYARGAERAFYVTLEKDMFEYELVLTPTDSWEKEDRIMWIRGLELPPPTKKELRKIKRGEGMELKLRFSRNPL